MKKQLVGILFLGMALMSVAGCASLERVSKDWTSEVNGGLNRVATVYDSNGNVIKRYEGKFDVKIDQYGNKVKFDINGKRVLIYNAIVIIEER